MDERDQSKKANTTENKTALSSITKRIRRYSDHRKR